MAILHKTLQGGFYQKLYLLDKINVNPPTLIYQGVGNWFTPQTGDWLISSVDFYLGKWELGANATPVIAQLWDIADGGGAGKILLATSETELTPSTASGVDDNDFGSGSYDAAAWETFDFKNVLCTKGRQCAATISCATDHLNPNLDRLWSPAYSAAGASFSPSFGGTANIDWATGNIITTFGAYEYRLNGVELGVGQPYPLQVFPADRPDDYDPDQIWTPSEEPYTDPEWQDPGMNYQAAGGGRWGQQLVAVGKGLIYYEERE